MARGNFPFLAYNRGLVSPKALARTDLDRTRLSADVFTNWLPKTQGAMQLRPGTKFFGSSLNDTGAAWIEFVAATDDTALLEMTPEKMRIWLGEDAHGISLLERLAVDTTVSLSDTGWEDGSTGGNANAEGTDLIPEMTGATTNGVTISTSSSTNADRDEGDPIHGRGWNAADNDNETFWQDTGDGPSTALPSWLNVDFGVGIAKTVSSYSLRAGNDASDLDNMPSDWRLLGSQHDTGTFATDTGKWALEDEQSSETGWSVSERRTYTLADTGAAESWRHWRLHVTSVDGASPIHLAEIEMFESTAAQVEFSSGHLTLNAGAIGSRAKVTKRVVVDTGDLDVEHSLDIRVTRGPVTFRVGSTDGDDDYVSETMLGTGFHNLAFTPAGNFHITLQTDEQNNRIVDSLDIGDTGTVEITAPWDAGNLDDIRYDQSADVAYVDCQAVHPQKIERRGVGRSWSVVQYEPTTGPFLPSPSSSAKMSVSHFYGNTTLNSDIPFFTSGHVGALMRIFHEGQGGEWALGALDAKTDPIAVTGIGDTGTASSTNERRISFTVSGVFTGETTIERSFDGPDIGFQPISGDVGTASDTGARSVDIDDDEDNIEVWYRVRVSDWTSGAAIVSIDYGGGGQTGIARITGFNSNTEVDAEVLRRFSDTGPSDNWQQGYWSTQRGFPSAVALDGGRLAHAGGANLFLSVSDDFENFDEEVEGDAGPIIRTLGSGPVDRVHYLVSLLRLIIGTAGGEVSLRSSTLDEPVTPSNSSVRTFSTQGSRNLRALKMDTKAIFVQRSGKRVFMSGFGLDGDALGDYKASELTLLVPDLLESGVASTAIQRQPDTRLHCVMNDGTVHILTYEPDEEVICWSKWVTDTGSDSAVERAMVLPGTAEDAVYYHIRRTINGTTKRFLEKWALEAECIGDTGLHWIMDCAVSFSDTGRSAAFEDVAEHLAGEDVIAWGDLDTGSTPYIDLSPDVDGIQTMHMVDTGGDVTFSGLTEGVSQGVVGLPYVADWRSTKLAYAAEAGTALAQMKRTDKIGFVLYQAHNNGLFFGNDTGNLDPLPRVTDEGAVVDADKIFIEFDQVAMPFPGLWDADSRIHLRAKAPRPMTVLAAVPTVETNEKV